jgi:hypothetical protein
LPDQSQDPRKDKVSVYGQYGANSFSQFFSTIKSMTIEFNTTNENTTSWQIVFFTSQLAIMNDGSIAYLVNMTGVQHTGNLSDQDFVQVWIDTSTSYIRLVSMGQEQWTGADAQQEAGVLAFLTTNEWLAMLNSDNVIPTALNQTTSIGSIQLISNTYQGLNTLPGYQNLDIIVGSIPQTGMQLVLSSDYNVPGQGHYSFRILSLELN